MFTLSIICYIGVLGALYYRTCIQGFIVEFALLAGFTSAGRSQVFTLGSLAYGRSTDLAALIDILIRWTRLTRSVTQKPLILLTGVGGAASIVGSGFCIRFACVTPSLRIEYVVLSIAGFRDALFTGARIHVGVLWAAFACSCCQLSLSCCASIRFTTPACIINIGVLWADLHLTFLVQVLALRFIIGVRFAYPACIIYVGEGSAVPAFSFDAENLSGSTGIDNALACSIDVIVIAACYTDVVIDVHLILVVSTFFTLAIGVENFFGSARIDDARSIGVVGVGLGWAIRAISVHPDFSSVAISNLDTLLSRAVYTLVSGTLNAASVFAQPLASTTGLLLASSIDLINVVIFCAKFALAILDIEARLTVGACPYNINNLEDAAIRG